jgi:hypothetical protein
MADEYTLPVLGTHITQLTRDWHLTNLNEELSSGLEWHSSHGIPKMLFMICGNKLSTAASLFKVPITFFPN